MADTQTDTVTSGVEWRNKRRAEYTIELPSGNRATIRPLLLDRCIAQGQIPDILTPWAAKILWEGAETKKVAEQVEAARGFADLVGWVVTAVMVDPKVVDDPKTDNEISLDDIHFRDKFRIFDLATEPAEWLRSFRDQQTKRLEGVRDSEQNGHTTQPDHANP